MRQVSTLLYRLKEKSDDVLISTNISEEDQNKHDKVVKKLTSTFNYAKCDIREGSLQQMRSTGR